MEKEFNKDDVEEILNEFFRLVYYDSKEIIENFTLEQKIELAKLVI